MPIPTTPFMPLQVALYAADKKWDKEHPYTTTRVTYSSGKTEDYHPWFIRTNYPDGRVHISPTIEGKESSDIGKQYYNSYYSMKGGDQSDNEIWTYVNDMIESSLPENRPSARMLGNYEYVKGPIYMFIGDESYPTRTLYKSTKDGQIISSKQRNQYGNKRTYKIVDENWMKNHPLSVFWDKLKGMLDNRTWLKKEDDDFFKHTIKYSNIRLPEQIKKQGGRIEKPVINRFKNILHK